MHTSDDDVGGLGCCLVQSVVGVACVGGGVGDQCAGDVEREVGLVDGDVSLLRRVDGYIITPPLDL